MKNGLSTHFQIELIYTNVLKMYKKWILTLVHKHGNISVNNSKNLVHSGEQARPAGWARSHIRPPTHIFIRHGREFGHYLEHCPKTI